MTMKSSNTIIEHIPLFLEYCKNKGLSKKTQENYKRYLNKFIIWLRENLREDIKPHELTEKDIQDYATHLSTCDLKDITQNYYLIALRALLSYFTAKDIVSNSILKK